MLKWLFKKREDSKAAAQILPIIIKQSRAPEFYRQGGVPDTYDGRFNLICFHAAIVMMRLKEGDEFDRQVSQEVFDILFSSFKEDFRQLSIGDTGVAKRIKTMAKSFYGRANTLAKVRQGEETLDEYAERNIFADELPAAAIVDDMKAYLKSAWADVFTTEPSQISKAEFSFPEYPSS